MPRYVVLVLEKGFASRFSSRKVVINSFSRES
jgi:hypothetical protein